MTYHFRSGQWDDACALVERFHYSRRVPSNVQFVGTLHEDGGLFGDAGAVVAAAIFSIPAAKRSEHVLELTRLVRNESPAPLSSLLSSCASVLKQRGERLLISFADRRQGHFGGVYQACSWLYAGCREGGTEGLIVDGRFIPDRTANHIWGTRSPRLLLEKFGVHAEIVKNAGKHLYYLPLGVAGKTRAKRLGLASLPYPKNAARPEDEHGSPVSEAGATPAGRSNHMAEATL